MPRYRSFHFSFDISTLRTLFNSRRFSIFLIFRYNAKLIRRHILVARLTITLPAKNFFRDLKTKKFKFYDFCYATCQRYRSFHFSFDTSTLRRLLNSRRFLIFLLVRYNAKVIRRYTLVTRLTINSPAKNFLRVQK